MAPIAIGVIVVLVRIIAAASRSNSGGPGRAPDQKVVRSWSLRSVVYYGILASWAVAIVLTFVDAVDRTTQVHGPSHLLELGVVDVAGATFLFLAWPILRWAGGRVPPKVVYYLAHFMLVFPTTGETEAGATLLAGLAMARRGKTTKAERAWLRGELDKIPNALSVYGAALATYYGLTAAAARDRGDLARAQRDGERARSLFGTITYMSPRVRPKVIKNLAEEYFALQCASLGLWGAFGHVERAALPRALRPLSDWVRKTMLKEEVKPTRTLLPDPEPPPFLQALRARDPNPPPKTMPQIKEEVMADHARLLRGETVSPRRALNVLVGLDLFLDPRAPETLIPEALRDDEPLVSSIHDDVADALATALERAVIPLHALVRLGPISARVYQRVETRLIDELGAALTILEERRANRTRYLAREEWLEVAKVRRIYRDVEFVLGEAALARVWPQVRFAYCALGVLLSEEYPRMRPLAYAVFSCLHREAVRFDDPVNVNLMAKNMTVTEYLA